MGQEKLKNKKTRSIGVRKTQEFANSTQVVDSEKALQALSSAELGGEFQVYPDEETGNFRVTAFNLKSSYMRLDIKLPRIYVKPQFLLLFYVFTAV